MTSFSSRVFIPVFSDVWIGVRRGVPIGVFNNSNPEWRHPLRTTASGEDAVYASGEVYAGGAAGSGVDFAALMEFGWRRECLHLREALDFDLRDGGCDLEKAFICEWKGEEDIRRAKHEYRDLSRNLEPSKIDPVR